MADRPDWKWFPRASELVSGEELDEAERVLGDALEAGHLWRVSLLLAPTLDPLRGRTRFESISLEARRRVEARHIKPLVITAEPAHLVPVAPLLLVLHGATGNASTELQRWRAATELGWIVAAGQSSQPATADGFCWDPPRERVLQDLRAIVAMLPRHARVILAGFSQGAWIALNAALQGDIIVAGTVVMVGPFAAEDAILPPAWRRLKVSILLGEDDPYRTPVENVARQLVERGHHVGLEVIPRIGHEYPPDFGDRLPNLLRRPEAKRAGFRPDIR